MSTGNEKPSLWLPMQNRRELAVIGKLGEETCELGGRIFRCVIQGMEGHDPDDEKENFLHLADEMADVYAMLRLVEMKVGIKADPARIERKLNMKLQWLKMIADHEGFVDR